MINADHPRYTAALRFLEETVGTGGPHAVALTGPAGAGTSAVLARFTTSRPDTAVAFGMPGNARLAPYTAAARLHTAITGRREAPDPIRRMRTVTKGFGTLLDELDQALVAGINTGVLPVDELAPYVDAAARHVADGLLAAAYQDGTRILAAAQIGWWDPSSLRVLEHLIAGAADAGINVIITDSTDRPERRDWLASVSARHILARHAMPGLDPAEITVRAIETGFTLAPGSAEHIAETTGGHPVTVELHLRDLAATGHTLRPVPAAVADAATSAFATLPADDQWLLTAAAAAGHWVDAAAIADIDRQDEDVVAVNLNRIARSTGLLTGPAPIGASTGYAWRHEAARDAIEAAAAPEDSRALHARASDRLKTAAAGGPISPETWIDICRHEHAAGPATSLGAAGAFLTAAEHAYMALAFDECDQIAALAQSAAADAADPAPARALHRAAAISYRLLASDRPGHNDPAGDDALAAEGEQAAQASGKPRYLAAAALARACTLQRTEGLDAQIAKLAEAHRYATGVDDPTLHPATAIAYARQWAKRDLTAARALLAKTETVWYERELTDEEMLWYNLGQMYYGVLSFDAGDFDTARSRLTSALVQAGFTGPVQVPTAANFAAQLHLALGETDEAIRALESAGETETRLGVTTSWGAYNQGLLAEHQARSGTAGAIDRARRAWNHICALGHPNLVPLIRGHLAETLYQAAATDADLDEASRLAAETIAETGRTGQTRSAIIAHALTAAIDTRRGHAASAARHAREAVGLLDALGDLPAMRTEEILWRCAAALKVAGHDAEVGRMRERARAVIDRKCGSMSDAVDRARFLAQPLSRKILDADSGMS